MREIKFSHEYHKLLGIRYDDINNVATLLEVIDINLEDLSNTMRNYDTCYSENDDIKYYPLPKKGQYLLLIFIMHDTSFSMGVFTTIRRSTPQKREYYKSIIGEPFKVVLLNEETK